MVRISKRASTVGQGGIGQWKDSGMSDIAGRENALFSASKKVY